MTIASLDPNEIERLWPYLKESEKKEILRCLDIIELASKEWKPLPGPQTMAFESKADVILYGGSAGGGKGIHTLTPIATMHGWTTMGDVKVGDSLFDEEGKVCKVTEVSEIQNRRVFEIVFDDGSIIIADDVHRWKTLTDSERTCNQRCTEEFRERRKKIRPSRAKEVSQKPWVSKSITAINQAREYVYKEPTKGEIRSTLDILETLKVREFRINHSIDVAKPLQLPEADLPVDPFSLGVFLGDGQSATGDIGMLKSDIDEIKNYIPYEVEREKVLGAPKYNQLFSIVKFNGFRDALRTAGVLNNKHIPPEYLRASVQQRIALLAGILDTDGHATYNGQIELGLSDKRLADDVLELVYSLGIKTTQTVKKTKRKDSYRIKFVAPFPVFKLSRKLARQKTDDLRDTTRRRYIVDVREIPSVPTKCIAVDSPSHLYLAGKSFIPTHNTDLALGKALHQHKRVLIMRREFPQLTGIIERARDIYSSYGKYTQTPQPVWRLNYKGRSILIELGACQYEDDKTKYMGRAHDLRVLDEAANFLESQVVFISGWVRSEDPRQKCQLLLLSNPPTTAEGQWLFEWFRAWLDVKHPNPAAPGELRYYARVDGEFVEVADGRPFVLDGKKILYDFNLADHTPEQIIIPKSRTYIPARVTDNPYYMKSGYIATLQALPEPLRSQMLKGDFTAGREDGAWQVIPTEWVRLAQKRWREMEKPILPMAAMGVDVARGGEDKTVLTPRYDNYFDSQLVFPGTSTPNGDTVAGLIFANRKSNCAVIIDVIGVGASVYDAVRRQITDEKEKLKIYGFHASAASDATDRSGMLKFVNQRSEWYWKFREALDPDTGDNLALPDDRELMADLCAATWQYTSRGLVQVEPKEDIIERIGRSPDKGDSCIYAYVKNTRRLPYTTSMPIMSR